MIGLLARVLLRNLIGYTLIAAGLILSIPGVPGPGSLVSLIGLALADWPYKRRFFDWLRSFAWFRKSADWVEKRFRFRFPGTNPHPQDDDGPATPPSFPTSDTD